MAILCCVCGVSIEPNALNMCTACIAKEVDFFEGLDMQPELVQCRGCMRYQSRGNTQQNSSQHGAWLACELESTQLMALCLRSIHGLTKFKLVDAAFIWTEPHSKRLKVKLALQREVVHHAVVQNVTVVTFVINWTKCPDCTKKYHNHTWRALVQIRQKAAHKRTFLRLEQLILKHQAHEHAIGITSVKDGLDFYFGSKSTAERFLQFLGANVPMRSKTSNKLISEDVKNATANLQTSYSVEISPICKDDLVLLPPRAAQSCGSITRLVVCARTTAMIHVVDPRTGQRAEVTHEKYWKLPFLPLESSPAMTEFVVLDVEPVDGHLQYRSHESTEKMVLADVEVARASDFGVNDQTFMVRSHLGAVLHAGDTVKGYDLSCANFGSQHTYALKEELPDIVLVRKVFPRELDDAKRIRKLKRLRANRAAKVSKSEAARQAREFEEFTNEYLEEVEYDGCEAQELSKDNKNENSDDENVGGVNEEDDSVEESGSH